jgi:TIR domain/Ricin-type beta-trefoil lectin domain
MNIFLSHASQDKATAELIAFSLRSRGHKVFLDRDDLPAGQSFDQQIEKAVEDSAIFIFLISPDSVADGHYTLTELKYARRKWNTPNGRVLPIMARKTPLEQVPSYLRAVTILEPLGNITAETSAAVDDMRRGNYAWRFAAELFARYRYVLALGAFCGVVGMVAFVLYVQVPVQPPAVPVVSSSLPTAQLPDPNIYYRLSTQFRGPNLPLDVFNGGSKNNMTYLSQFQDVSGQYWHFQPNNDGSYRLMTMLRGPHICLDIINGGPDDNEPHLTDCDNFSGQIWRLQVDGTSMRLRTDLRGPNMCLDIIPGEPDQPHLAPCGNFSGQLWLLSRTGKRTN